MCTDYGLLTAISGKLPAEQTANLQAKLQSLSAETGMGPSELLLRWAYDGPCRILVTSSSRAERTAGLIRLLAEQRKELPKYVAKGIEEAAEADGYEGKIFYSHAHMEQGSARPE